VEATPKNRKDNVEKLRIWSMLPISPKTTPRIIELVDSFKTLGCFSEGKACYWLGYAYDRLMKITY
jgi:hypothetical protein